MSDRARAAQIRRLEACLALPENRECFDCGALRPRWASTNLGIFVCMRCAGIHRSLGTHISKVKSINMDVWDEEMIRNCETIGNGPEGKWRYEANMPASYTKPKMTAENREVEGYIRLKFESKAYYPRPDQHGPTAAAVHHEPAHHASAAGDPSAHCGTRHGASRAAGGPASASRSRESHSSRPHGNSEARSAAGARFVRRLRCLAQCTACSASSSATGGRGRASAEARGEH
jgi:hypothetical protein